MAELEKQDILEQFAKILVKSVKKVFDNKEAYHCLGPVEMKRSRIIEFMQRMRVYGIDKFEAPTFVSTVNFYANLKDMEKHKALGVLVLYIEQDYVKRLLNMLQYPDIPDDDEELKDACGTLCNVIAGQFKIEISSLGGGYQALEMSHFSNYRNSALRGVEFNSKQMDKIEISFTIRDQKRLVLEFSMGEIGKK